MNTLPLLPRRLFFGNPDRAAVRLSPDGAHLSWLAPLNGVLNVWIAPRRNPSAARPVTHDTGRGVLNYFWAYTNAHILFLQDRNGDENFRLYALHLATGGVKHLTPHHAIQARVVRVSPRFPGEVVVGLNHRNAQWHDLYRINLVSGETTLLLRHERFFQVVVDDDFRVRVGVQATPDGGAEMHVPAEGGWRLWGRVPAEDFLTGDIVSFDRENRRLFMKDSRGRNTSAIVGVDLETGETSVLAEDLKDDAADVLIHPTGKHVQAVSFVHQRKRWQVLDPEFALDLEPLRAVADGDVEIVSRSLDDRQWIVLYLMDDGPARFYLYDRERRRATFLFANRQGLENQPLAKMRCATIPSRDALDMVAYYTLPPGSDSDGDGIPDHPLPMVFTPHGGPWDRDFWGLHPWHQWLANRGYAVLGANFRGSTGFGKAFTNAGDREWGGKMIEDQVDAVQWAITSGIAERTRVAIMGGSFGGFSTLAGLTFTPELYACGVDLFGVSDLVTWMESIPDYWKPSWDMFIRRIGDPATEEGRALLRRQSPLTYADRICRPLLIAQGASDPRVRQAESDQIVRSMRERGIPVTYVLYPDEGHGFARPENRLSFYAMVEEFLAKALGGRCEPLGRDGDGSSGRVVVQATEGG